MERPMKIFIAMLPYILILLFLIMFQREILTFDLNLFFLINGISNSFLDYFLIFLTLFGSSFFWIIMILLLSKKNKEISIKLFYVFVIDSILLVFLKFFFFRPRPYELFPSLKISIPEVDIGTSFPSGHSERAFSGAVIIGSYYPKFRLLLALVAFLVGVSRIYLGFHYPLDVLYGCMNGIIIGCTVLSWPTKKVEKFFKRLLKH